MGVVVYFLSLRGRGAVFRVSVSSEGRKAVL